MLCARRIWSTFTASLFRRSRIVAASGIRITYTSTQPAAIGSSSICTPPGTQHGLSVSPLIYVCPSACGGSVCVQFSGSMPYTVTGSYATRKSSTKLEISVGRCAVRRSLRLLVHTSFHTILPRKISTLISSTVSGIAWLN